ncbi:MAG: hypothetical protein UW85_C0008G0027, partial [Parcubacteria group bacterium GW2011_GWA1_Parcubacteria_45_10]
MKRLVFLALLLIVFLVACAPATETLVTPTSHSGWTQPEWTQPDWSGNQTQSIEVVPSEIKSGDEPHPLDWWLILWIGYPALIVFGLSKAGFWFTNRQWNTGSFLNQLLWIRVLIVCLGIFVAVVAGLVIRAAMLDSGFDQSSLLSVLFGLLSWAWILNRVAYWIM